MNQIVNINTASTLTMSSREIAELTGKRHDNICRDVFKMLTGLKSEVSDFLSSYSDPSGRRLPLYNLPKRETLILVSGYSVELRARIIDRWMELEAQVATKSGSVTAAEVTAMLTQYVSDTEENCCAPRPHRNWTFNRK